MKKYAHRLKVGGKSMHFSMEDLKLGGSGRVLLHYSKGDGRPCVVQLFFWSCLPELLFYWIKRYEIYMLAI